MKKKSAENKAQKGKKGMIRGMLEIPTFRAQQICEANVITNYTIEPNRLFDDEISFYPLYIAF